MPDRNRNRKEGNNTKTSTNLNTGSGGYSSMIKETIQQFAMSVDCAFQCTIRYRPVIEPGNGKRRAVSSS